MKTTVRTTHRTPARIAVAALLASLVVGCSGDVAPLEEAIEVRDKRLDSLTIERPSGTLTPLVINAGERVSFPLSGLDVDGRTVEIGSEGRSWRVSNEAVASIDANGELVALTDGATTVDVRIGDIVAAPFDVLVSTSSLRSIERIVGADQLDPCVIERYTAVGTFGDESERLLRGVAWSVDAVGAELRPDADGGTELSASRPDSTVELIATVEQARLAKRIDVNTSLTELVIERADQAGSVTSFTVNAGTTLQLRAIGSYTGADGIVRSRDVTDSVVWETVGGAGFATVSNDPATRGLVTTTNAGTAQVRASCGATVLDTRQVVVVGTTGGSSDADELSFDGVVNAPGDGDGGSRVIGLGVGQVQLRVSTGSTYDADEDVTDDADWTLENPGEFPIGTIGNDGSDKGVFRPLNTGFGRIRVVYRSLTVTLDITVN